MDKRNTIHPNTLKGLEEYRRKKKEEKALIKKQESGHPWKYRELKDIQERADEYFESCKAHVEQRIKLIEGVPQMTNVEIPERPMTAAGLALALGITRGTLFKYVDRQDEVGEYVKKALTKIEGGIEEYLLSGKPTAGASMILRNGFGWKEETEQKVIGAFSLSNLFDATKNADEETKQGWEEMERIENREKI